MKFIPKKIKTALLNKPEWFSYVIIALFIPAYWYGVELLTLQQTYYVAILSKVSVNIILLFGLAGHYVSRYTKGMSKWKGWAIWFVVMLILILFFKYVGGLETRWF